MGNNDRFAFIDATRGIAILGVIVGHVASITNVGGTYRRIFDLGAMGVELFFVVSAFTIFLTYSRAISRESAPIRNFFIRRLMRIVPVYWLGIVIYTLFFGLASRGWTPGPELSHYPLHLTLTNIFVPSAMSSVVPGGWSISLEVMFYLTVPLWFAIVTNLRRAVIFTVAAAVFGIVFTKVAGAFLDASFIDPALEVQYLNRSYPSQLACFGVGMILFYLQPMIAQASKKRTTSAILIGLTIVIAAAVVMRFSPVSRHFPMMVAFLCLTSALALVPWSVIVNRFSVFLGQISYSTYLLHFLIIKFLMVVLPIADLSPLKQFAIVLPLAVVGTIPLAFISYLLIEKRTSLLAKEWIAKLEQRRPAVTLRTP